MLQRCPKEPPSRRGPDGECGGAAVPCGGQCLTPRSFPGEKERPVGRKRPPTSASEGEEDEQIAKVSYAEKRARITAG